MLCVFKGILPENPHRKALSLFAFGYSWFVVSAPYAFLIAGVSSYREHTSGGGSSEFSIYFSSLFLIFLLIIYSQIWYLGSESDRFGRYVEKLDGLYVFGLVSVGYIALTMVVISQPYNISRAIVILFLFFALTGPLYILFLSATSAGELEKNESGVLIKDILLFLALGVITSLFLFPFIPLVLIALGAVYLFNRLFPKAED